MKLVLPLEKLTGPVALPGVFLRGIGVCEVLGVRFSFAQAEGALTITFMGAASTRRRSAAATAGRCRSASGRAST